MTSSNDIASKLSQSVRMAKQPPSPLPESDTLKNVARSDRVQQPAAHPAKPSKFSDRGRCWDDLHPKRIWPD